MRRCDKTVAALAVAVTALLTGCVAQGRPVPERPDLAALDVGAYSAEPLAEPRDETESDRDRYGRVLESARMGEAIVDPVDVDPALTHPINGTGGTPLPTPAKVTGFLANPVRNTLEVNRMLAGFAVGFADRESGPRGPEVGTSRVLTVFLLRFPDAESAQRAARDIDAVDTAVNPANVAVAVPEYPAAHAHWRPNVPTLAATIAHESFVVSVLAGHTSADSAILTGMARKAFDLQLARLREFVATPRDRLAALPLDPEGMVRRMAPEAPGRWPFPAVAFIDKQLDAGWSGFVITTGVVYGRRAAALVVDRRRDTPYEAFAFNGFNALARYADAGIARQAFTRARQTDAKTTALRPVQAPSVPDVYCMDAFDTPQPALARYSCRILYGRYVATIFGRDSQDVRQRAAVQYGLLVRNEQEI
ncbi:hypothetical protein [Nocardia sp. NPDC052566]|uniref:DUF7373 family lipoprotein n=1 Tax=Nocardia sp. NPDC052566 TaxID=3364330 RepID=UPI0037CB8145